MVARYVMAVETHEDMQAVTEEIIIICCTIDEV
jgi:hypothetical protein